jgi:hypothetical protein
MDQDRGRDPNEERGETPEGVRIIGAEEAAEALERPDVAHRRTGDQLRYGDRPPSPPAHGPRPVLRFPLGASDDPADVERPPVAPSQPISEPVELPHWTEPPTGQVPAAVTGEQPAARVPEPEDDLDDDADAWAGFAPAPRWRDESSRGEDDDEDVRIFGDDSMRIGALDESERISHDDYLSFADLDERVLPGRSVFADLADEDEGVDDFPVWEPQPFEPEAAGGDRWDAELDQFEPFEEPDPVLEDDVPDDYADDDEPGSVRGASIWDDELADEPEEPEEVQEAPRHEQRRREPPDGGRPAREPRPRRSGSR